MTPSAQIQSAMDVCQQIFDQATIPADKIMNTFFRNNRYIGAKDKRAIATYAYEALRFVPRYQRVTDLDARLLMLMILVHEKKQSLNDLHLLCSGDRYAPDVLSRHEIKQLETPFQPNEAEVLAIPEALYPFFIESMPLQTLQELARSYETEASIDLRVNSLKASRDTVLQTLICEGFEATKTPHSPLGIRLKRRQSLDHHPLFTNGTIDVQDEGSQLLALACGAESHMNVLDYCAGAGGKTLALAAQMKNKGQLFACDIHEWRLKRARERVKRADVHNVRFYAADDGKFLKRHTKFFDRVLVDAPCSGTGTWRRNPDMKFKTTPQDIDELRMLQRSILTKAAPLVREWGWLIYATCSVLKAENDDQIAWFLENHPEFKIASGNHPAEGIYWGDLRHHLSMPGMDTMGLQLFPHVHATDGFYVTVLVRQQ